jgi:DNA-binding CsgD family transcriptional regulator
VSAPSPAEKRLLELLSEGMTGREMARDLGVGGRTVHSRLQKLRAKAGARNHTHLVVRAVRLGWITIERVDGLG